MNTIAKFQIGKASVTSGVLESLSLVFKTHKTVRISFLKSSGRDRESTEKMAQEIAEKLATLSKHTYVYSIIGFTVIIHKRLSPKKK